MNNVKLVKNCLEEVDTRFKEIRDWIAATEKTLNGRPLLVPAVFQEWSSLKSKKVKQQDHLNKYSYLFPGPVKEHYQKLSTDIDLA